MLGSQKDSYKTQQTDPKTRVWETRDKLHLEQQNSLDRKLENKCMLRKPELQRQAWPCTWGTVSLRKASPGNQISFVNHLPREEHRDVISK